MNNDFDVLGFPLVQVPVWSLKTMEPFKNLFPIRESVLSELIDDMSVNGFDSGHPIIAWNMTVVDGHSRLKAAIAVGMETVPVICRCFVDEDEALDYAIRSQRNRRNLTDGELLQCLQKMDWRKKRGHQLSESNTSPGKSASSLADALGISRASVERLRAINEYSSDEIKNALRRGELSIHRAYEETMRSRRPVNRLEPDADAEVIHSVMADIHARLNEPQIRKLVKKLQIELATN